MFLRFKAKGSYLKAMSMLVTKVFLTKNLFVFIDQEEKIKPRVLSD